MDITNFRIENGELTISTPVACARDAYVILCHLFLLDPVHRDAQA